MESNRNIDHASSVLQPIQHLRQTCNWDCGLACVAMVIPNFEGKERFLMNRSKILAQEDLSTSIWSIDLAYILKGLNIKFIYYTSTIGINEELKNEPYYNNNLDVDRHRVENKFANAISNDVKVTKRILNLNEILIHLRENPIIALVDYNQLVCCHPNHPHMFSNKLFSPLLRFFRKSAYIGHYVVLTGYDSESRTIIYNDPNLNYGSCRVTLSLFEESRNSRGTDHDIILIKD